MQGLRGSTRAGFKVIPGSALRPLPPIQERRQDLSDIAENIAEVGPEVDDREFDVFISHAAEDKDAVDAVVAFYSIYHLDRELHHSLYCNLRSFLPAGGLMYLLMGTKDWHGSKHDFHGREMRWSSYGPDQEVELMRSAGFEISGMTLDGTAGENHIAISAVAAPFDKS